MSNFQRLLFLVGIKNSQQSNGNNMDWLQSAIHTFTRLAHQWRLERQSRFQARCFSFLINQNLH